MIKDPEKYQRDVDFERLAYGEDYDTIKELMRQGDPNNEVCGKLKVLKSLLGIHRAKKEKVIHSDINKKLFSILNVATDLYCFTLDTPIFLFYQKYGYIGKLLEEREVLLQSVW